MLTTAAGRRLGYVTVKDMIGQALAPLETAFSRFRAEGVQDVVLDLRYNGGGLVSTGGTLASYVAGTRGSGRRYATLLYNDKRSDNNQSFGFSALTSALGLPRVFVLMGRRTCSASEQVVNGLRGVGVEVVAIGETSCGKPVGSLPTSTCDRTYSVINFESVNERNEGRYFDGFDATCDVAEDFTSVQGSPADPLLAAASHFADSGNCPVPAAAAATRKQALSARATSAAVQTWASKLTARRRCAASSAPVSRPVGEQGRVSITRHWQPRDASVPSSARTPSCSRGEHTITTVPERTRGSGRWTCWRSRPLWGIWPTASTARSACRRPVPGGTARSRPDVSATATRSPCAANAWTSATTASAVTSRPVSYTHLTLPTSDLV